MHWYEDEDLWSGFSEVMFSPQRSAQAVQAVQHSPLLGFPSGARDNQGLSRGESELCRWAMRQTDVLELAGRSVLTLSGGERQRVLIARALVQQPRVLVLDEPTNHLDVRHQVELLALLRSAGRTVLVALHDLNLAAAACHRLGVLSGGSLVAAGRPGEVLTPNTIPPNTITDDTVAVPEGARP